VPPEQGDNKMSRCKNLQFVHQQLVTSYPDDLVLDVAADVVAMPVTHPYISKTTGADAEALTLADGVPGQLLVIQLAVDGGGTGTLTPTTTTGFSTIAFADAGDNAVLLFIDDTIGWIILSTHGLTAQPTVA